MSLSSIGDLAQTFALRRQSTLLRQQMARLTDELSSGQTSNVTRHLAGNLASLADVEHSLTILDTRRLVAERSRIDSSAMQAALDRFQSGAQTLANTALTIGTSSGAPSFDAFAKEGRAVLGAMLSTLNTSVAGRSLFAGDDVSSIAISQFDDFMSAIRLAVGGATSAVDVNTALDTFFDTPGGGFDTLIYQGSLSARASYPLGEGETVSLDLRADHPAFRFMLKQAATISLLDDTGIALSSADKAELTALAGTQVISGQTAITDIRADLGFAESRIDRASSRISAEIAGLSMIRNELLSIDPFQSATELETVQLRLETLYTLTSRMSRLNLVNFLS